ncbi:MAG: hypothetical protein WCS65_03570 [Verrucomicrobiae bacterium]
MPPPDSPAKSPQKKRSPPLLDALLLLKPNIIFTMASPKEISAAASPDGAASLSSSDFQFLIGV